MSTRRSSFYNSYLGETKNKFQFSNFKKNDSIAEPEFFKWTSGNMYRTSYNDMANRVSKEQSAHLILFSFHRVNLLIEKTVLFLSTRDTFPTSEPILFSRKD
jgi:hypothetical protein